MTDKPGFAAVAARYSQEVADFLRGAPQRAYEFAYAYGPQGESNRQHSTEMAETARAEVERRVARAANDTTFALEWGKKIVKSGEMRSAWAAMSGREKIEAVQRMEYDDELATYCRNLALLTEIPEPAEATFPARHRAHRQAQRVYAETIGPYSYEPRQRRPDPERIDTVVADAVAGGSE